MDFEIANYHIRRVASVRGIANCLECYFSMIRPLLYSCIFGEYGQNGFYMYRLCVSLLQVIYVYCRLI